MSQSETSRALSSFIGHASNLEQLCGELILLHPLQRLLIHLIQTAQVTVVLKIRELDLCRDRIRPDLFDITWYTLADLREVFNCKNLMVTDDLRIVL